MKKKKIMTSRWKNDDDTSFCSDDGLEDPLENVLGEKEAGSIPSAIRMEEVTNPTSTELTTTVISTEKVFEESPQQVTTPKISYTSMVDPDEGTALTCVPLQMINGHSCAKIERIDVQKEVDYWASSVLCCIIGSNPPVDVVDGFVHRIWKDLDIDKVVLVRKGVYLVHFNNIEDKTTVLK
ncbi:hypothetical protein Cgig2_023103 [Carnegiea gigantea]|uniref:DUF4283 domain-containing protein n=1 Tax=Carnegiea gigantea TaxID=171969 RepID=A0A9Q1GN65_9CARY|nr:hypothetical protein Cgig2_023103 [Carnegiea gigantea]